MLGFGYQRDEPEGPVGSQWYKTAQFQTTKIYRSYKRRNQN